MEQILPTYEASEELSRTEKVRIDMLKNSGYYSTESNGHLSEYVAWYRKHPEELAQWIDLGVWINGETGGYLRGCHSTWKKCVMTKNLQEKMPLKPIKLRNTKKIHL